MKLQVQPIKCYSCPLCKTIHKIAPQAHRCLKNCIATQQREEAAEKKMIEMETIRNSVRFEARSLTEAINLLVSKSKEHYNIQLHIDQYPARFGMQSITHVCPIGKETNWSTKPDHPRGHLGWHGRWEGTIRGQWKSHFSDTGNPSFSDYIGRNEVGFYGFNTGTGSGGSNFSIDGTIFLEDFPLIHKKEIKKYEGNKLCCQVHSLYHCPFCKTRWCGEHIKYLQNIGCPFDGHTIIT